MPKLAIQEDLLPGATLRDKLALARRLGLGAVEFQARGLDERIDEIEALLAEHGLAASGLHLGGVDGWLAADRGRRDDAADLLRRALAGALDLGADYLCFVPHYGSSDMPDLTPFASPMELQRELLIWLLRGMSDLAEAMDAELAMLPIHGGETDFLTRLEQGAALRREVDEHPKIRLAADTFHMSMAEADLLASLRAHQGAISALCLRDDKGGLPGTGQLPFAAIGAVLAELEYSGWLVIGGAPPSAGETSAAALEAGLEHLRRCGLG